MTDARFKVWIIAPQTGTGTLASRMRLLQMFKEEFAADFRPADVQVVGAASPLGGGEATHICGRDSVDDALEQIAEHNGPRLVWVVATTRLRRRDRYVDLDGATDDPLTVGALWEDLEAAASKQPSQPLIALVDACHAAPPTTLGKHEKFAWICSSALDEKARSTDAGAWMTLQLVGRLTNTPGPVQLQDLTTHLANVRDSDGAGQRPLSELGDLATRVLNRVGDVVPHAPTPQPLEPAPGPEAALAAWRRHMLAAGTHLRPLFGAMRAIDEVYVDVSVGHGDDDGVLLADLLAERAAFVIEGHAGAGKTTLARRLTCRLAEDTGEGARVPVYLELAAFALSASKNLVDYAGERLKQSNADAHLADTLPAALRNPSVRSRLCFLLDGLDEVRGDQLAPLIQQVEALVGEFAGATIAVFTRPMGDDSTLGGYRPVRVLALSRTSQQRLLTEWLKDKPGASAKLWETIEGSARLQELAGNPMLLTMLALVAEEGRGAPKSRAELYRRAIDVLLTRGHQRQANLGVSAPQSARVLLRHLSLALQIRGGEAWTLAGLAEVLEGLLVGKVQVAPVFVEGRDIQADRADADRRYSRLLEEYDTLVLAGTDATVLFQNAFCAISELREMPEGPWALASLGTLLKSRSDVSSILTQAYAIVLLAPRPELETRLPADYALALHAPDLASTARRMLDVCGDCADSVNFLKIISTRAGIIHAPDGWDGTWTYLHRSLRDTLAAEQLFAALKSGGEVLRYFKGIVDTLALGRWGETFSMLAELAIRSFHEPRILLDLAMLSPKICLHVLFEVESLISAEDVLEVVDACPGSDGEHLAWLAKRWKGNTSRLEVLRRWASSSCGNCPGIERAAQVHYALSEADELTSPEANAAFFESIDRPQIALDLGLEWCSVASGTVDLAARANEPGPARPARAISLAAFSLGRFAVTKGEFQRFDPTHECPGGPAHPVTKVSWYLARLYARWARADLPTEAEWEYACRAGTTAPWSFGEDEAKIGEHAWYRENSNYHTHPVGQKLPNPGGLYDMHGNVWEWCHDWHGPYPADVECDPRGPDTGTMRIMRGGDSRHNAFFCRSDFADWDYPSGRNHTISFRLCRRLAT